MTEFSVLNRRDSTYPTLLTHCEDGPNTLYCRGDISLLRRQHAVSIVGTRTPTTYGLAVTNAMVNACVEADLITVSGMAFGIDARVHEQTIARGGKTIAVLGSPVADSGIYPRAHVRLAHRILESGGVIISEYPEDAPMHKGTFPARNRIIAGLSTVTCVIEAREKSGSLITAYQALNYNRTVCAVPGSIFSAQSHGTHALISRGAVPWLSADTLSELFPHIPAQNATRAVATFAAQKNLPYPELLEFCATPKTFEEISKHLGLAASTLQTQIATLVLQNALTLDDYGHYITTQSVSRGSYTSAKRNT